MSKNSIDLVALANDGQHFAERRNGVVRIIDSLTGKVVAVQSSTVGPTHPEDFSEVLLPNGQVVLAQKGLEKYALDAGKNPELAPFLVDIICQKIVEEGKGIVEICREPGMPPYATLCRWRRKHSWVAEALNNARIDRAEHMRDKAVTTAEAAANPDFDSDKLKVETYKWAAGVDDQKFSPRAKVEANINLPTQLVVVTGIDRTPIDRTPEPLETKARDVSEQILKK